VKRHRLESRVSLRQQEKRIKSPGTPTSLQRKTKTLPHPASRAKRKEMPGAGSRVLAKAKKRQSLHSGQKTNKKEKDKKQPKAVAPHLVHQAGEGKRRG